jgi:hypothetical protein
MRKLVAASRSQRPAIGAKWQEWQALVVDGVAARVVGPQRTATGCGPAGRCPAPSLPITLAVAQRNPWSAPATARPCKLAAKEILS